MATFRHHLTLIDLIATVAAAALGMVALVWDPLPPSIPVAVILFWLIVPLMGIVWGRWRGGRGILGGVLGGAAQSGFGLIWVLTGPHRPGQMGPNSIANDPIGVVLMIAGFLTFGTVTGVATWLVAAAMGRSVAPPCRAPMTDACANGES